jgi:histidinol dehydrogenase
MKRVLWGTGEAEVEFYSSLLGSRLAGSEAEARVEPIVRVFQDPDSFLNRDKELLSFTKKFDGVSLGLSEIAISLQQRERALKALSAEVREALQLAANRIRAFHEATLPQSIETNAPGERLVLRPTPIRSAGLYAPGGTALYPSTVLMNAIAAKVAGVEEVVLCTPPGKEGQVHESVMAAAAIAGVDRMFRVGGAQAIAAMAYGTPTIPKVDKIVGPGNVYVTAAKRLVRGEVDIDKEAGPSEVVVVLGTSDWAAWAAADMIAQAEHDPEAMAVGIAMGEEAAGALEKEVASQLNKASRLEVIEVALKKRGMIIEVKSPEEALEAVERIAPEHLELLIEGADAFADKVRNAGAIFCGRWSPVPLGDYIAGPNHVLPTGRSARFASPLGVLDFIKWTSLVRFDEEVTKRLAGPAATLADLEGLPAHAQALRMRLEK